MFGNCCYSGASLIGGKRVSGWLGLLALFLWALYLRWLLPAREWQHGEERAFILHPSGFRSGDFNPHFFNYPALHFHLASVLYYLYYLMGDFVVVPDRSDILFNMASICVEMGDKAQAVAL